jgi:hypothetical protein
MQVARCCVTVENAWAAVRDFGRIPAIKAADDPSHYKPPMSISRSPRSFAHQLMTSVDSVNITTKRMKDAEAQKRLNQIAHEIFSQIVG